MNNPTWNPEAKPASLRKWAESSHKEAKRVFLADKTHAQILFAFQDAGLAGITIIDCGYDRLRRGLSSRAYL